ncbi:MAG TPA: thermonuclease family protein, partial [Thermodesulfobacteriota bacterium]|nr:thermonuclease family protein [Thermodesulfobacteriota bacterium]
MRGRRSKRPEVPDVLTLLKKTRFFKRRKGLYLLLAVILILLPLLFKTELDGDGVGSTEESTVERVIDGDTVVLQDTNSTHTRYLGIDAPEILTEESPGDPLSEEAKNLNRNLVNGKTVRLEFDKEKYDDYGRMLAYVFVDNIFVNEEIVRRGLAKVLVIKPNDRYANEIYEAQDQAKRERRGIWGNLSGLKSPSENTKYLIKTSQASRYIGQRVVVRGKITDFRKSPKVLVL